MSGRLRVVIVTSNASGNAARVTEHILHAVPEVEVVGAIVDRGTRSDRSRQRKRLAAWWRHGGPAYVATRLWSMVLPKLDGRRGTRYHVGLEDLAVRAGFELIEVPNVNSPEAATALERLHADLGVSIGNRIIKERIFTIPRLGMINLHHGAIPDYRGGPPGFWELHDDAREMGISVHRIDAMLDHGDLLAAATVPVLAEDDTRTLVERARQVDHQIVAEALRSLARGESRSIDVDLAGSRPRTLPSRADVRRASRRRGRRIDPRGYIDAALPAVYPEER